MAPTAVTVTGTAVFPSGEPIPGAVVSFNIDEGLLNSAAAVVGNQAIAAADGTYSIVVSATDDGGTAPTGGKYNVQITDPVTGEHVENFRSPVPHATTPTTIAAIKALAD